MRKSKRRVAKKANTKETAPKIKKMLMINQDESVSEEWQPPTKRRRKKTSKPNDQIGKMSDSKSVTIGDLRFKNATDKEKSNRKAEETKSNLPKLSLFTKPNKANTNLLI